MEGHHPFLVSFIAYRDTFQALRILASQLAPKSVGVPMVKPQYKPYQCQNSIGHHHDYWKWGTETTFFIVPAMEFGRPPWPMDLKDFLDKLVF